MTKAARRGALSTDWELDTATLTYRNIAVTKKTVPFRQEEDRLVYSVEQSALKMPGRAAIRGPGRGDSAIPRPRMPRH